MNDNFLRFLEVYDGIKDELKTRKNGYMTDLSSIQMTVENLADVRIRIFESPINLKVGIQKEEFVINIMLDSELSNLYKKFYLIAAFAAIFLGKVNDKLIICSDVEEEIYCLSLLMLLQKENLDKALNSNNSFKEICLDFGVDENMLKHRIALDSYLEYTKKQEKVKKKIK